MVEIQPNRGMFYLLPYQAKTIKSIYLSAIRADGQLKPYAADISLVNILNALLIRAKLKGFNPEIITEKSVTLSADRGNMDLKARTPSLSTDEIMAVTVRAYGQLKPYQADIYQGQSLKIETTRGGLRLSSFIPKFTTNLLENISWNDDVFLLAKDIENNVKFFRGIVRDIDEQDRWVDIDAITGDGILAERKVKENYNTQDIGVSVKDMVNKYGRPITTVNVDQNTGIEAPIQADGKTIVKVLEELRRQYNINFYVDNTWDLNFYSEDNIIEDEEEHISIKLGE